MIVFSAPMPELPARELLVQRGGSLMRITSKMELLSLGPADDVFAAAERVTPKLLAAMTPTWALAGDHLRGDERRLVEAAKASARAWLEGHLAAQPYPAAGGAATRTHAWVQLGEWADMVLRESRRLLGALTERWWRRGVWPNAAPLGSEGVEIVFGVGPLTSLEKTLQKVVLRLGDIADRASSSELTSYSLFQRALEKMEHLLSRLDAVSREAKDASARAPRRYHLETLRERVAECARRGEVARRALATYAAAWASFEEARELEELPALRSALGALEAAWTHLEGEDLTAWARDAHPEVPPQEAVRATFVALEPKLVAQAGTQQVAGWEKRVAQGGALPTLEDVLGVLGRAGKALDGRAARLGLMGLHEGLLRAPLAPGVAWMARAVALCEALAEAGLEEEATRAAACALAGHLAERHDLAAEGTPAPVELAGRLAGVLRDVPEVVAKHRAAQLQAWLLAELRPRCEGEGAPEDLKRAYEAARVALEGITERKWVGPG